MEYHLRTKLNGNIAMTSCFHENSFLQRDRSLYKFIWVRHGTLDVEVDHVVMHLEKEEMISLTPLHHVQIRGVGGEYLTFLFNSNFYCIYRHDSEVSCNGFLFNGSSRVMRLKLSPSQSARLDSIVDIFRGECGIQDNLQEEMLRIILKRFIITCTRIAREKFDVDPRRENMFDVIRQFYVLVDSLILRRRSKYRIMLICCAVLPRLFLISFPFTDFLLLCVSFMNAWMRKPSACCFIRVRVRKKSVRFWDLRIWLRSAVSLRK